MRIIVLVKEVPDTWADPKLDLETGLADRAASETVLDEIGERAIEVALNYGDKDADTEVVLLTMGPQGSASTLLRKGLAMGATSAVHVTDELLVGADLGLTAEVLAAAVQRTGYDLVITGNLSTDGGAGAIPAMVAEILDVPQLTALVSVNIDTGTVSGTRATDAGTMQVSAALPAVISITEALPDARFPNFRGIMAAKKKSFEIVTLADLSIDPDDIATARSIMLAIAEKPPRKAGVKIIDEGDAGNKLAEFLTLNRLV